MQLISHALRNHLIIPSWGEFCGQIKAIFEEVGFAKLNYNFPRNDILLPCFFSAAKLKMEMLLHISLSWLDRTRTSGAFPFVPLTVKESHLETRKSRSVCRASRRFGILPKIC